jgi:phosphoglycerol transferase MdoB-like AlkP superfamily enzyme
VGLAYAADISNDTVTEVLLAIYFVAMFFYFNAFFFSFTFKNPPIATRPWAQRLFSLTLSAILSAGAGLLVAHAIRVISSVRT